MGRQPCIIRETCGGNYAYQLEDDMLLHREVECVGEITAESVNSLISQLRYLARRDAGAEITMYINSPGGEVSSGLALYDVMKAVRCPIRTVCVGMAASMGAVLLSAGDRREILKHARVMIHDPLMRGVGGSALHVRSLSEDLMRTREILCEILAEHTGKSIEEIYEKTCNDTYFYAEEAVAYGLVDRVIEEL
ncbi:MAG: ATP-dependent Clp protease proteolytic subunit [Lachnospiraceae bacterium]|nr:ATP-dependent Clp protease proteolytic subunit [Lachnospiraceae bacterium]